MDVQQLDVQQLDVAGLGLVPASRQEIPSALALLIATVAAVATGLLAGTAAQTVSVAGKHPGELALFAALTVALQLFSVEVVGSGGGRIGVSAIGVLSTAFALGVGPAVFVAALTALVQAIVSRGIVHRAVFDIGNFATSAGAGGAIAEAAHAIGGTPVLVIASFFAGAVYSGVNNTFLCLAIGLSADKRPLDVWRDRFSWARWHYIAFGPLAYAWATGYSTVGAVGVVAFALPPALVLVSVRQYLNRTREMNEELQSTNEKLEDALKNISDLYEFSRGLAAQPHEREAVVTFARNTLSGMLGAPVRVAQDEVLFDADAYDRDRWAAIGPGVSMLLATVLENADLAATARRRYLATITALSRTMEAKDDYTGSHTERVARVAVALGERLGFGGTDLDALEIGALLHDIGKIGIPERILHKPAPLDSEEWVLMQQHPVISNRILGDVELPDIVHAITRSSHERIDGTGYPDGLAGDDIPLAARIVFVADAWDALTSDRPYRSARQPLEALHEIRLHAGTQFCPNVVAALEEVLLDAPEALLGDAAPLGIASVA